MSRRHADIWSHPGHYKVDHYTWPWSTNGQDHIWPSKFKYQGHGQGQTNWSYLRPRVKSICLLFVSRQSDHFWLRYIATFIFDLKNSRSRSWPRSNMMVTFEAYSSVDMFAFRFVAIGPFWQRYSPFHIWPWKINAKVMAKVKPDGHIWVLKINRYVCFSFRGNRPIFWLRYSKFHIWPCKFKVKVMAKVKRDGHMCGLEFSRCVCFSFRGNRTIFGWDIANFIFDLENSRSRSRRKSTKI